MSYTEPGMAEFVAEVRKAANAASKKAKELYEWVDSFDSMTEEEFAQHVGDQYTGAANMRQWLAEVEAATSRRESEKASLDRVAFEVLARCQRETAAAKTEKEQQA